MIRRIGETTEIKFCFRYSASVFCASALFANNAPRSRVIVYFKSEGFRGRENF